MGRRHDAALAAAVLLPAFVAAVALDAPPDPTAAAVGVVGTLALELGLSRRAALVRRTWERPAVRALAVAATALAAAAAVLAVGPRALTALVAGLATYLLVLGAVTLRRRSRPGRQA